MEEEKRICLRFRWCNVKMSIFHLSTKITFIKSFPSVCNQMQLLISAYLVKLNPGQDTKQRLPWGSARCWYQWTKPPIQVFHLLKFVQLLTILISYHNAWFQWLAWRMGRAEWALAHRITALKLVSEIKLLWILRPASAATNTQLALFPTNPL